MTVEVAYALPEQQSIIALQVPVGTTAEQAIVLSGIRCLFPQIEREEHKIGVFSKVCKGDQVLREGDRVEIYRKLIADPKAVRKQRAAEGKPMKKGGADA